MNAMDFRGKWVLVTGASSGIGRAMAVQLAREHGAHLILVARRAERLTELQRELTASAGVQVDTVVADLSKLEDVDRVIAAGKARRIYAAILSAGVTHFGPHSELSWAEFAAMLDTNVRAPVRMTMELLPLLESHPEGGGLMLMSSMTGLTPVPYQSAYAGTKAFLATFGVGLWHELKDRNVSLTTYAPGGVATEMTAGDRFDPLRSWLMDADRAARSGLKAFQERRDLFVPGVVYRVGQALIGLVPRKVMVGGVAAVYRRALQKTAARSPS